MRSSSGLPRFAIDLILELMARGGMRIGEVLKLRLGDLQDRKLILREPKSGREYEFVFIPQKVADRLREYALQVCNAPNDRIFPISYEAARVMVIKSGKLVGSNSDRMICAVIRQPLHHDPACRSKLSARSSFAMRICQRHNGTWEPSAMLKRFDGLRIYTAKARRVDPIYGFTLLFNC